MKYGDLSNQVAPRIIVVFEGAIAHCDEQPKLRKALKRGKWDQAANLFQLDDLVCYRLNYLTLRKSLNISVVTWMPAEMPPFIEDLLINNHIIVNECYASVPANVARSLSYFPDIIAVYDPDPGHVFTYGGKGILLKDPNQIGSML